MAEQRTYRLITKDDALVRRVVRDIEHAIHLSHEHDHTAHVFTYKVVPPMNRDAGGFTRTVYLHARTDEAAALAEKEIADIKAMTCRQA
jgi:hypothetical protein